jgi:hypothetical protein
MRPGKTATRFLPRRPDSLRLAGWMGTAKIQWWIVDWMIEGDPFENLRFSQCAPGSSWLTLFRFFFALAVFVVVKSLFSVFRHAFPFPCSESKSAA